MYRHHRISEAHWPASLAGSILSTQRNVSVTVMCAVLNNSPMQITGPIGLSWPEWLHSGGGVFFLKNLELPVFKSIKQSWVQDVFFWFPRVVSVGRTQCKQQSVRLWLQPPTGSGSSRPQTSPGLINPAVCKQHAETPSTPGTCTCHKSRGTFTHGRGLDACSTPHHHPPPPPFLNCTHIS